MRGKVMKKILALAILIALLAVPVIAAADPQGVPNENAGGSIAAYVDGDAISQCDDYPGFSEIGVCISTYGGYYGEGGLSYAAKLLHKPV
jgi:opacity protein-like surface antigen